MTKRVVHVSPSDDGTWSVKSKGKTRAFRIYDTKPEAIQSAKSIAKKADIGQVMILKSDGALQTSYTYKIK